MKNNTYTIEQLEKIQQIIKELINYVEEYNNSLSHCGLKDYYIVDNDFEIQKDINTKLSEYIDILGKCINIATK